MLPLPTVSPRQRAWYAFAGIWLLAALMLAVPISEEVINQPGPASNVFSFIVFSLAAFLPIIHDWVMPNWERRWIFFATTVTIAVFVFLLLIDLNHSSRYPYRYDEDYALFIFLLWGAGYFLSYWLTRSIPNPNAARQEHSLAGHAVATKDADEIVNEVAPVGRSRPSVWKYIWAWVVASSTSGVAMSLLYRILAPFLLAPSNFSTSYYWTIAPIAGGILSLVIWILVYSFFSTLRISKVVPWMWGLMGLGYLSAVGQASMTFDEFGYEMPGMILFSFLAAYLLTVLGFSRYFQARQRERY